MAQYIQTRKVYTYTNKKNLKRCHRPVLYFNKLLGELLVGVFIMMPSDKKQSCQAQTCQIRLAKQIQNILISRESAKQQPQPWQGLIEKYYKACGVIIQGGGVQG
jgi:hypothetical protein